MTLIERKLRMFHIRGIQGEVVIVYYEPLITKEMRHIGFPEGLIKW